MRKVLFISVILTSLLSMSAYSGDWSVFYTNDKMRNTSTKIMQIKSTNTQDFDFPFGRGNYLSIILRSNNVKLKPEQKESDLKVKEVLINISDGMFMCQPYDYCYVSAKFDNDPVEKFDVSEPQDGSYNLFFVNNNDKFIKKLMKSKRLILEATFYQGGNRQFDFDLSGYDNPKIVQ